MWGRVRERNPSKARMSARFVRFRRANPPTPRALLPSAALARQAATAETKHPRTHSVAIFFETARTRTCSLTPPLHPSNAPRSQVWMKSPRRDVVSSSR